ncbi:hypothetical protein Lalb_Chr23g0273701 [Lupinus albus]|uniref:Uncharacterized protein n=1 Tax=Lupinus albus TaxID=3870 RepID=A0A6A4N9A5_LUPAL|nr:hypothetical protein Lalb_Chr23g0273701 [Lupinus albus]
MLSWKSCVHFLLCITLPFPFPFLAEHKRHSKMFNSEGEKKLQEHEQNGPSQQEWETMARAWICSFPEAKEVTMPEVEAWINSNLASLPEGLRSVPRPVICAGLISVQNRIRFPINEERGANQPNLPHARFQRTDQWIPVYSWLEALDKDEIVKSNEIADWLTENPKVQEQLCSRHSQQHLMHYIKKCHSKILKRREKAKRKGLAKPCKDSSSKDKKVVAKKHPAPPPSSSSNKLPKDSDVYSTKENEAYPK